MAGYYSKDLIISLAFLQGTCLGYFSGVTLLIAAMFTSAYSAKLVYYIFLASPRYRKVSHSTLLNEQAAGESFFFVVLPLSVLSLLSVYGGLWFKDIIAGFGTDSTLNVFAEYSTSPLLLARAEFLPVGIKVAMFFVSVFGYVYYFLGVSEAKWVKIFFEKNNVALQAHAFFYHRWYFDLLISNLVSGTYLVLAHRAFEMWVQKVVMDRHTLVFTVDNVGLFSKFSLESSSLSPRKYLRLTFQAIVFLLFLALVVSPVIVVGR